MLGWSSWRHWRNTNLRNFSEVFDVVTSKLKRPTTITFLKCCFGGALYFLLAATPNYWLLGSLFLVGPVLYGKYQSYLMLIARLTVCRVSSFSGAYWCERQGPRHSIEDMRLGLGVINSLALFPPVLTLVTLFPVIGAIHILYGIAALVIIPLCAAFVYSALLSVKQLAVIDLTRITAASLVCTIIALSGLLSPTLNGLLAIAQIGFCGVAVFLPLLVGDGPLRNRLMSYTTFYLWTHSCDRTQIDPAPGKEVAISGASLFKKTLHYDGRNAFQLTSGSEETPAKGVIDFASSPKNLDMAVGVDHAELSDVGGVVKIKSGTTTLFSRPIRALFNGWNKISLDEKVQSSITVELEGRTDSHGIYFESPFIKRSKPAPRTIVLIIADALARDSLRCYEPGGIQTPAIDTFFKDGAQYLNAYAQGEWTMSNFWHMFSSYYSSHHGCTHRYDGVKNEISRELTSIAEVFQREGFYTFFCSSNRRAAQSGGYDRGFQRLLGYDYMSVENSQITYQAIDALDNYRLEDKFIVLHYVDTHAPPVFWSSYRDCETNFLTQRTRDVHRTTPDDFEKVFRNQVREFNLGIGALLGFISQSPHAENTAVILTADHGQTHLVNTEVDKIGAYDLNLSERMTRLPLLVSAPWIPEMKGQKVSGLIESGIDLYPTLLELGGLSGPHAPYAKSYLVSSANPTPGKRFAVTESIYEGVVQRVIRSEEATFYRRFNWTETESRQDVDRVWRKKDGALTDVNGEDLQRYRQNFHEKERDLKLVLRTDDPNRYYGPYIKV